MSQHPDHPTPSTYPAPKPQQIRTWLWQRLILAKIPFQRQGNNFSTAFASIEFTRQWLILRKPGKAQRQLRYDQVKLSQLLRTLQSQPTEPA